MKKIIFTLFLVTLSLIAFGQTIVTISDFNNCITGNVDLIYIGSHNGKNDYSAGTFTLKWENNQWELKDNGTLIHTSSTDVGNKPPCSSDGSIWTAVGGCSSLKLTGNCTIYVLPVELAAFTATVKANQVTLDWITASEIDNEGFEIQHSTNGTDWKMLEFVEGMGTTYETTRYDYTHIVDNSGTHFYRLMQEDFDGTTTYSDVVTVKVKANLVAGVVILPNYVINDFRLATTNESERYDVQIFDTNGRLIRSISNVFANTSIDASELMSGIYFVRISYDNQSTTQRIVKF